MISIPAYQGKVSAQQVIDNSFYNNDVQGVDHILQEIEAMVWTFNLLTRLSLSIS